MKKYTIQKAIFIPYLHCAAIKMRVPAVNKMRNCVKNCNAQKIIANYIKSPQIFLTDKKAIHIMQIFLEYAVYLNYLNDRRQKKICVLVLEQFFLEQFSSSFSGCETSLDPHVRVLVGQSVGWCLSLFPKMAGSYLSMFLSETDSLLIG